MDIFKWLDDELLVASYNIKDFRKSDTVFYLNITIQFVDISELHVREYIDVVHRKYSFHWQKNDGDLICRWDNAPHFQHIATFPHHKHLATGQVSESFDISFDEIMKSIQDKIKSNDISTNQF